MWYAVYVQQHFCIMLYKIINVIELIFNLDLRVCLHMWEGMFSSILSIHCTLLLLCKLWYVTCQLSAFIPLSATTGWGKHRFFPSVCFKCFFFSFPFLFLKITTYLHWTFLLRLRVLLDISGKWFMLNICQTCRLIKWSIALKIIFNVMTFGMTVAFKLNCFHSVIAQCANKKKH